MSNDTASLGRRALGSIAKSWCDCAPSQTPVLRRQRRVRRHPDAEAPAPERLIVLVEGQPSPSPCFARSHRCPQIQTVTALFDPRNRATWEISFAMECT